MMRSDVRDRSTIGIAFRCVKGDCDLRSIVVVAVPEQPELRRIARGLRETEMTEGMGGQQAAARGALQIAALNQKRFDDVLDRVARLRQRGGERLDADRT